MLTTVSDTTLHLWNTGRRVKRNAAGWLSGNAPCCVHNGESADTRMRGGLRADGDGSVGYSCFNCGYKTVYKPGQQLSFKFRRLLKWMGADDNEIQRLVIDAIRVREMSGLIIPPPAIKEEVKLQKRSLPEGCTSFKEWQTYLSIADDNFISPVELIEAVEYIDKRCELNSGENSMIQRYDFYVTDDKVQNMHKRVIIPCYWEGEIIGYTARTWDNKVKPKYLAHYDGNYVFNMDRQRKDSKFVIVMEGPFDAMAIDGVSTMHGEISDTQADIIQSLGKEVIVVPDFDVHNGKWPGEKLVDQAIEFGWSVSFPQWNEHHKDVSAAVQKMGKLFTMQAILAGKESNPTRIKIKKRVYKEWQKNIQLICNGCF
jgi:hypothetical protein